MRHTQLFGKTIKNIPKDEVSLNAQLLTKAGYIDKLMSGAFTYLPLGLKVLRKIQNIIREEIDAVGGQEILMPALSPKENWQKTGRWDNFDALFHLKGSGERDYALCATHEEIVTPLVQRFVKSYKDLPVAVYQIQDKFRDEPRAKSGLLRGREFCMKDLYSFHADEKNLDDYYEKIKVAYFNIFKRCGLDARIVEASGGTFSKLSHEYQVFAENGEDTIRYCEKCDFAQNVEISQLNVGDKCPVCGAPIVETKGIEVGNIFKLYTKYSKPFDFQYIDAEGKKQDVIMGCYGIGPSRLVGTIVEVSHDDKGIVWPKTVAPYQTHLLVLGDKEDVTKKAEDLYQSLKEKFEVLFDDRKDVGNGAKLNDSDLIGLPVRVIVSEKTLAAGGVEIKFRNQDKAEVVKFKELEKIISQSHV
jgi:prolyl-tRNA synthetase